MPPLRSSGGRFERRTRARLIARMGSRGARDVDVREAVAAAVRTGALGAALEADGAPPATEPLAEGGALVGTAPGQVARSAEVAEVVANRAGGVARVAGTSSAAGAAGRRTE
jgi:hypothetical protein